MTDRIEPDHRRQPGGARGGPHPRGADRGGDPGDVVPGDGAGGCRRGRGRGRRGGEGRDLARARLTGASRA
ncbi:hypothetical protein [Nocardioides convexus]|uniref:hypothetical protein n=1 Tax=Nocardioides convexus TaxID=2712224 RepID=UPI002418421A|nr:hypothetical protein [Nocardioides convexus]